MVFKKKSSRGVKSGESNRPVTKNVKKFTKEEKSEYERQVKAKKRKQKKEPRAR